MYLLYAIAQTIADFLDAGPPLILSLIYFAVASVPVVFLHELGHALAARQRLGGDVEITVGSAGRIAELRLGQVAMSINALVNPYGVGGTAAFDASRATARDVFEIALAGPIASAGGFISAALVYSALPAHGLVHNLFWAITFCSVFAVLNLIPFTGTEGRDRRKVRSDGRLALDALRVMRALR